MSTFAEEIHTALDHAKMVRMEQARQDREERLQKDQERERLLAIRKNATVQYFKDKILNNLPSNEKLLEFARKGLTTCVLTQQWDSRFDPYPNFEKAIAELEQTVFEKYHGVYKLSIDTEGRGGRPSMPTFYLYRAELVLVRAEKSTCELI